MWHNHYLKFPTETDFKFVLGGCQNAQDIVFDVIGDLSTENHVVEGFHVNVRSREEALPVLLDEYSIYAPEHPKRIWFGE